ncbi:MAG: hypothetical protein H6618_04440 [Deltaproteobacteria bacterium]|nr:hypothetical protein [Deltaproteobacteria bacterium]
MSVSGGILFRLMMVVLIALPAALFQTVFPVIEEDFWEDLNDHFYHFFLKNQRPDAAGEDHSGSEHPARLPARVAIVLAGQKSREILGDPIPRRHYIELLGALKESSHPWIMSDLRFGDLIADGEKERPAYRKKQWRRRLQALQMTDKLWIDSLSNYRRFISSSVFQTNGSSTLAATLVDEIGQKMLLSALPSLPRLSQMPFVSLQLSEPSRYLLAAPVLGLAQKAEEEKADPECIRLFSSVSSGSWLLPTAMLWTFAYASESGLILPDDVRWPSRGKQPFILRRNQQIATQHCLSSPSVSEVEYLQLRHIRTFELVDLLRDGQGNPAQRRSALREKFGGKVLILSSDRDTDLSSAVTGSSGSLPLQTKARFLDELLARSSILRNSLISYEAFSYFPLVFAIILIFSSLFFSLGQQILFQLMILTLTICMAVFYLLYRNTLMPPLQGILSITSTLSAYILVFIFLKYYSARRLAAFRHKLRERLSLCSDIEDMKLSTQSVCASEFSICKVFFIGYDEKLYEAASSWESARDFFQSAIAQGQNLESILNRSMGEFSDKKVLFQTVMTSMKKISPKKSGFLGDSLLAAKIVVNLHEIRLGILDIQLSYAIYEEDLVARVVMAVRDELALCWARIERQAADTIRNMVKISGEISTEMMSRFLPPALIQRFNPDVSSALYLQKQLRPSPAMVVMIQADIRGFTDHHKEHSAEEVVRHLQEYYLNILGEARKVAQVKLLGDSIFIFIREDLSLRAGVSATDLALLLSASLVRQADRLSERPEAVPLHFGLAIHRGESIVGSFSGESGVDYTVVGKNVNLVTRVEELSKVPSVYEQVGTNAILMTAEARHGLLFFSTADFHELNLESSDLMIRSFPSIRKLFFADKKQASEIAARTTLARVLNPDLPLE